MCTLLTFHSLETLPDSLLTRWLGYADDALLQQAKILQLRDANKSDLNIIKNWILRPDGGNNFFRGRERAPWEEGNAEDLVSLDGWLDGRDHFTLWIKDKIVPWYHDCWGHRKVMLFPN